MQLDLLETERRVLVELFRNAHADIGPEIDHTMDHEYREGLRQRRTSLEELLKRLGANLQPSQ